MRLLVAAFFLSCVSSLSAADSAVIRAEQVSAPAHANAVGASVATSPDGTVWLTWLERNDGVTFLRCSLFQSEDKRWSPARTVAQGSGWFINSADFPAVAVGPRGRATVVWSEISPPAAGSHGGHAVIYHARFSQTTDGGRTWTQGAPLTSESESVEFVSVTTLADGRVLAAWLDGRNKSRGGKAQQLFSRVIGGAAPDTLVDPSVCDCCQTALTAFPDGTALLAYRGRSTEEVRDIRVTRFRSGQWDAARSLHQDDWTINGCPVNGPQLASDGGRVAAAWFTAADNNPRALVAISTDAGHRFMTPTRLSEGKTLGRVSTAVLHDGAMLATSVDADGVPWLRRVSPDFTTGEPLRLPLPPEQRVKGFPRLALLRDYLGGDAPAQLIAVFTGERDPMMHTALITVPEGELLVAEKSCDCAPTAEELQGFPLRGTFLSPPTAGGAIAVRHFDVPGIFSAGTRELRATPAVIATASPGRQFMGRIERRAGEWWLFDARLIASPPSEP